MPCFSPLQAWRGRKLDSGKRAIVFRRAERCESLVDSELSLPCGQCLGCRLERSRQWAMRCVGEASCHKRNCFITLTYDAPHLPQDGGLSLEDWQLFMKRLRKYAGNCRLRFFMCGEYGERLGRPHFHACLFNWDFADKVFWSCRDGVRLYRSSRLEKLWGKGFATVGDVTFESAAYVARYCVKKAGVLEERYEDVDGRVYDVDSSTGVIRVPEFTTMSRRDGIGKRWFDKFKDDLYPSDFHVVRGVKCKPARYYDALFEREDAAGMRDVRARRLGRARLAGNDNDLIRLRVKEACRWDRVKLLRRSLEEEL